MQSHLSLLGIRPLIWRIGHSRSIGGSGSASRAYRLDSSLGDVKWVGLFAVALVGVYTIEDLWNLFGDLSIPKIQYIKHWIARIICLIVIPIAVYMLSFAIHFAILNRSGPGDAQMSSLFQAGLVGNSFDQNPLELAYGSRVTFKNYGYGGGLLHSHIQTYPSGSEQQQVTCYHHKDGNNEWIVKKVREEPYNPEVIEYVGNGDVVRLVHEATQRNLHSHAIKAPITMAQWEVSCYGNETIGDLNDYWKIEVVDDIYSKNYSQIRSLTTRMRFRHSQLGCYLSASNVILPQWGFKQVEVVCDKRNRPDDQHTWWNIEQHYNPKRVYTSSDRVVTWTMF
ncbi:MIR motif-containing protein [Jimgerdemannia flammicorona]|uniref:dolichyl-phosphate-mannose--protein mannosyltransferase n=1 Tax=Jimgerdemannia flammicorona TaxID=994334 RepID=A0A433B9P0_9FUNG|nr:MIR motif-containing protein [Jimgerdemannia flammicorona]